MNISKLRNALRRILQFASYDVALLANERYANNAKIPFQRKSSFAKSYYKWKPLADFVVSLLIALITCTAKMEIFTSGMKEFSRRRRGHWHCKIQRIFLPPNFEWKFVPEWGSYFLGCISYTAAAFQLEERQPGISCYTSHTIYPVLSRMGDFNRLENY